MRSLPLLGEAVMVLVSSRGLKVLPSKAREVGRPQLQERELCVGEGVCCWVGQVPSWICSSDSNCSSSSSLRWRLAGVGSFSLHTGSTNSSSSSSPPSQRSSSCSRGFDCSSSSSRSQPLQPNSSSSACSSSSSSPNRGNVFFSCVGDEDILFFRCAPLSLVKEMGALHEVTDLALDGMRGSWLRTKEKTALFCVVEDRLGAGDALVGDASKFVSGKRHRSCVQDFLQLQKGSDVSAVQNDHAVVCSLLASFSPGTCMGRGPRFSRPSCLRTHLFRA